MQESPQVAVITREDLRAELHAWASEFLEVDIVNFQSRLQRAIRADLQDLFSKLHNGQNGLARHGSPSPCSLDLQSADGTEPAMSALALPGTVNVPEVLPPEPPSEPKAKILDPAEDTSTERHADKMGAEVKAISNMKSQSMDLADSAKARKNQKRVVKSSARRNSMERLSSSMFTPPGEETLQRKALRVVNSSMFDYIVAALILTNGIMIGIQTDWLANEAVEDPPLVFQVIEIVFCVLFTIELALRLFAFRCRFFTMQQKGWNIFDFIIVTMQLLEIFMSIVAAGVTGFSFNILRILRLVRVVRLARALRLIGELRTIVSSILGSVKPLFWTGVLLVLMAYVVGVAITQLVHTKRMILIDKGEHVPEALERYWGRLFAAIFTLIQSITGGVDWDDVCRPLMEKIGVEVGLVFTFYILFCSLAMLNVVTGVFIDAVMENGKKAKEHCTKQTVQALFAALDVNHEGEIQWHEFESQLQTSEMKEFFHIVDVDISNARSLFELLDLDDSGAINAREFMDGCLRIWSPAKDLDLRMIARDITRLRQKIQNILDQMNGEETRVTLVSPPSKKDASIQQMGSLDLSLGS